MTTTTQTPEEALRLAFDTLDHANRMVTERQQAQAAAQQRLEQANALQAAAQLQLTNAEAKYRVLSGSVELAGPEAAELQAELTERERELNVTVEGLQTAEAEAENARLFRLALNELADRILDWLTQAEEAAIALRDSADITESLQPGARSTTGLKNIGSGLRDYHTRLRDGVAELASSARRIRAGAAEVSMVASTDAHLAALQARREWLEAEVASTKRELLAKEPRVDPEHLRKAKDDVDQARQANAEAPAAAHRAQTTLTLATDALAAATQGVQAAQNGIDTVEAQFVDRIEVSAPNAAGIATAHAVLKLALPVGYALSWQAGDADVEPETGETVHIDTTTLPVGQTPVVATLERQPTAP